MPLAEGDFNLSGTQEEAEASGFLDTGKEQYRKGNYTAAIASFTKALQLRNVPFYIQIIVLDKRAAAWEMIGGEANLELALQDGMRMIQLSKVLTAGYLRVGRTYKLLNRHESARKVLKSGIEQVGVSGPKFEV